MAEFYLTYVKAQAHKRAAQEHQGTLYGHLEHASRHEEAALGHIEEGSTEAAKRETNLAGEALQDTWEWMMKAKIEQDTMAECIAKAKGDNAGNIQSPEKTKLD